MPIKQAPIIALWVFRSVDIFDRIIKSQQTYP